MRTSGVQALMDKSDWKDTPLLSQLEVLENLDANSRVLKGTVLPHGAAHAVRLLHNCVQLCGACVLHCTIANVGKSMCLPSDRPQAAGCGKKCHKFLSLAHHFVCTLPWSRITSAGWPHLAVCCNHACGSSICILSVVPDDT